MHENKPERSSASSEKRDPGFVKIRRGLLAHLRQMSSNATKLYLFFHLKAFWQGPKRGCVEANIDDLMFFLGWSRSMVKRTIAELVQRGYILFEGAANQHEQGTIRISKFDAMETDSAQLTGEPSMTAQNSAGFTAGLSGGLTGEPSSEPSTPSNPQSQRDLQAPKNAIEVKKEKNERLEAVRRPNDAELRSSREHKVHGRGCTPSKPSPLPTGKDFSLSEKRILLGERIAASLTENRTRFDREFEECELEAFDYIRYEKYQPTYLADGFVTVVAEVYLDHKDNLPLPGILCSKIIDRCKSEIESCKKLGMDRSDYYWPPDFQKHRDRLRAKERESEQRGGQACA